MFKMSLERADGTSQLFELDLDFTGLDPAVQQRGVRLWDGESPQHLAAALLFAGTGLPDEDFDTVGPVLLSAVEGEYTFEEIS